MAVANVASTTVDHNVPLTGFEEGLVSKRVTLTLILVSMTPSLVYASLLPHIFFYLQVLGEKNDHKDPPAHVVLGFVLAAFSVTKMILNSLVGWMSNFLELRLLLFLSMLCQAIAAAGFALVRRPWELVGVYALLGVAAANSTVCRVYVPRIVHEQTQRVQLLAWLTAGTTVGFIVGPALGALLALIGGCSSDRPLPVISFNGCTSPGWLGAMLGAFAMCLTPLLPNIKGRAPLHPTGRSEDTETDYGGASGLIFVTIALQQLAIVLPFAAIESLTAPICAEAYGWTPKQVGILFSAASLLTLPWPFMLKVVLKSNRTSPRAILLSSMLGQTLALICLADFQQPFHGDRTDEVQFIIAFCAYYVFYVIAQTTVFTLFYSLLAEHPKCAVWIGWISSTGSLGRWIWPLVSVNLFSIGAGTVWLLTAAVVALLGPALLVINWRHLGKRTNCEAMSEAHISVVLSEVFVSEVSGAN
jgi:MFS family permease